jgi:hypothetical protein
MYYHRKGEKEIFCVIAYVISGIFINNKLTATLIENPVEFVVQDHLRESIMIRRIVR